jgi:hypothetical protein
MVHSFLSFLVSLVYGIYPEITRLTLGLGFTSLTDGFPFAFPGLLIERTTAQAGELFLQVIDTGYLRYGRYSGIPLSQITCHTF